MTKKIFYSASTNHKLKSIEVKGINVIKHQCDSGEIHVLKKS